LKKLKTIVILLWSILGVFATSYAQQSAKTPDGKEVLLYDNGTWIYADSIPLNPTKSSAIEKLEIPKNTSKEKVLFHTGYALLYNETHEQASWVAYELTKAETTKVYDRTDKFITDPMVKTGSATDEDYKDSGYDRGHLAPASDMGWSETTMRESFYYSNMSPQVPNFNRGIWKKLEELVRTWAIENEALYIVTGPVLTDDLSSIGPNKVSVPKYFYKVILDYKEPYGKGIGFILPNEGSKEPLENYAVSIDSVEKITGIDFFPLLEDEQEEGIEKTLCVTCWSWKSLKLSNNKKEKKDSNAVQCSGFTKKGNRCQRMTTNASGKCYQHE